MIGIEYKNEGQQSLAFIDGPEDIKAYEYSVLVTDLDEGLNEKSMGLGWIYHPRYKELSLHGAHDRVNLQLVEFVCSTRATR